VLNEVARIATEGTDLGASLSAITALLSESFDWEFVACVSIDHERGRFRCEAVTSRVPTEVRPGYGRELGSGVVGLVAARGEPILLDDVRTFPDYVETLPGALSELCVPVRHRAEVIAVLNLESTRLSAFHDQLPLLVNVARQVAGAIHLAQANDRLLEANRRLSQANRRLEAAQRKIVRLTESGASALANPGAWARAASSDQERGAVGQQVKTANGLSRSAVALPRTARSISSIVANPSAEKDPVTTGFSQWRSPRKSR
ncbi:GAF domain-containing protein, partial [Acidobacteria bacterium ACD]|nr:GAF domain-containing protein [Acidobacteria bacterium ACD]